MGLPKVSANTKLLGIASLLTDVSSEMAYPLLPFFLSSILMAPAFALGLMESLGDFAVSAAGFLAGLHSDRIGRRKRIIIAGYSVSAAFKAFLVVVSSWPQLIALRVVERAAKGARDVPRDALVGLSEEKGNLGNAFGFRRTMDNIGALLGPLLATLLLAILLPTGQMEQAYRAIFLFALVPAVLAVGAVLLLHDPQTAKSEPVRILKDVFRARNFREFLAAGMAFAVGQFSMMFFLLRASDFMPLILVPVAYLAYNVFYTIFSIPAGMLADKIGARLALSLGFACFVIALAGFAFFPSQQVIFLMFVLLGLFMAIAETAPQILLIRTVESRYYASAIGAYKGLKGVAALPANLIAGLLYTVTLLGTPSLFLFSMGTGVLGIVLLLALVKEQP